MELVKSIISPDGKNRIDIERNSNGLYRYVTFDDRWRDDPDFHEPPEWSLGEFSGLYDTLDAAEADARANLPWLAEIESRLSM